MNLDQMDKIGFGGGCHWCTEAVFQSIKGVNKVLQGYIATSEDPGTFYEGILIYFNSEIIDLEKLIEIHLKTHKSTSNHSMRNKYLSAVYTFNYLQQKNARSILERFQKKSQKKIITRVILFGSFRKSREQIRNYYRTDPQRPFCKVYIEPKIELLKKSFPSNIY